MSVSEALGVPLPKLPRLDKEDVKAIRRFLPGKLLSRTAALLSLVLLVLGSTTAVDQALQKLLDINLSATPWLRFGLLLGLPLLAVSSQLVIEWRAERDRRARQQLAVHTSAEHSGYFRIGPYLNTDEDQASFHRADGAHRQVLSWIERSNNVPLYLTGDSGSGKSSLLNASVLPALTKRGRTVVEARAGQDPEAAIRNALPQIGGRRQRQGKQPTLRSLIEAAARRADEGLLLVLDQFEEFVILGSPEKKQEFAALLTDLRASPIKKFSMLLVLRSDYQSFLEDIGLPPLRQSENLYQVNRFRFAAATDFLARSGLKLQAAAIDRLLNSSAELDETPGLVRPITLNVIGYVLATGKAEAPSLDAGRLVRHYIEQTIRQPAIRDFAPKVLEQLVTEQATKRPRSEEELAALTHLGRGDVRAVLNGLGAAALTRPLNAAGDVWELSHDFVARAVSRYLGRRHHDLLRRGAFYAAPALLATMLVLATSVIAWNSISEYRTQSELAKLGLSVVAIPDGLSVVADPDQLSSENFAEAGRLLDRLSALRILDLSGAKIESLEPIKHLRELQALNLGGTAVKDLQPLRDLTALRRLNLGDTKIEDLEPLTALTGIEGLVLVGAPVENLEPLRGLTALRALDLGGTRVRNLKPLDRLIGIQVLLLSGTKVERLEPLEDLVALQRLDLSGTKVENLEPIVGLSGVRVLNLDQTRVKRLEPLAGLTGLQQLSLSQTKVERLEPLAGLTGLQQLDLSGTDIENLQPLQGLAALQALNLSETRVENLEPLRNLPCLQSLILVGTVVQNLESLADLPALQLLNLNGTKVQNLDPLDRLPALLILYLGATVPEAERVRLTRARQENRMQPVEIRH
jgi:Leucine-rich repeat (LRR) protein